MKALMTASDTAVTFLRRGGLTRPLIVTLCTAAVSALIAIVLAVLAYGTDGAREPLPDYGPFDESALISNLITDDGVRGGYVFALLLICLAPLLLLRQVLRVGTVAREQRLASFRLAGATMSDVRWVGAFEVALPAAAGGVVGWLAFWTMQALTRIIPVDSSFLRELRVIPTSVTPPWWQVLAVVVGVTALGGLAGASASRGMVISPVGVSRRAPAGPPRPWGALLLVLGVLLTLMSSGELMSDTPLWEVLPFVIIVVVVLGLLSLAPFVAYATGRWAAERATTVPGLLASRRLCVDARPAGRAGAAVSVVTLATSLLAVLLADLPQSNGGRDILDAHAFYLVPMGLTGVVLLVVLCLVILSMALHVLETVTDHRRSIAGLAALGLDPDELDRAVRWEVAMATLPLGVLGVLLGGFGAVSAYMANGDSFHGVAVLLGAALVLGTLLLGAVLLTARLTQPRVHRATDPEALRVP